MDDEFFELLATTQSKVQTTRRSEFRNDAELRSNRRARLKLCVASSIVATVLREVMAMVEPGQTTEDLDAFAEQQIREMGATQFQGYHGFPASRASINNEVVHASPKRHS